MRTRLSFAVMLTVRSPFLFRDPAGAVFGIDAAPLRDPDGRPLIPADQIRGVLRESMLDLSIAAPGVLPPDLFDELFGRKSADSREDNADAAGDAFDPNRANILCDDLVATGSWPSAQAVRVAIEAETGAARAGFLQIAELVAPPGADVIFAGCLVIFAEVGTEAAVKAALSKALALEIGRASWRERV